MTPYHQLGKLLLTLGVVLVIVGAVLAFGDKIPGLKALWDKFPLGRLPGDISIRRENYSFHFPWVTCLVISVVVTLLLSLFRK